MKVMEPNRQILLLDNKSRYNQRFYGNDTLTGKEASNSISGGSGDKFSIGLLIKKVGIF
jgi:hypothetical protein